MSVNKEFYTLTNENIDIVSKSVMNRLSEFRMRHETMIRIRFSIEEALLRMQAHFGTDAQIRVTIGRRFHRQYVEISLDGAAYNPLKLSESEYEEWNQLLSCSDYSPDYQYAHGRNILRWSIYLRKRHPYYNFVLAAAVGIILGLIGMKLGEGSVAQNVMLQILKVFEEIWMRILNVMSGPVIFMMVITMILNMDDITRQGGSTNRFIKRIIQKSLIVSVMVVPVGLLLYHGGSWDITLSNRLTGALELLLQLIPEDSISPFIESNSPQLIIIAIIVGSAFISSSKRYDPLSTVIRQANSIGMTFTEWMGNAVPVASALLIALAFIEGETDSLLGLWKCLLLFLFASGLSMLILTVFTARRNHISPALLWNKLKEPFFNLIRNGYEDDELEMTYKCCVKDLGIEPKFARAGLSVGLVMFMPVSILGSLIYIIYAASMHNIVITPVWCVLAVLLTVIMSVANPPLIGVSLLSYVVLFKQLGIPNTALIAAMLFDVMISVIASAMNQYLLQLELVESAADIALIDRARLEKA